MCPTSVCSSSFSLEDVCPLSPSLLLWCGRKFMVLCWIPGAVVYLRCRCVCIALPSWRNWAVCVGRGANKSVRLMKARKSRRTNWAYICIVRAIKKRECGICLHYFPCAIEYTAFTPPIASQQTYRSCWGYKSIEYRAAFAYAMHLSQYYESNTTLELATSCQR